MKEKGNNAFRYQFSRGYGQGARELFETRKIDVHFHVAVGPHGLDSIS